jgi:two-component system, cell cycle sensor histidine kinase PleC
VDVNNARPSVLFNRITLRFRDREIEQQFATEVRQRSLNMMRLFVLSGTVLYALFGVLDGFITPGQPSDLWMIRYGVVCPSLLLILALTYTSYFARYTQLILAAAMLVPGGGIIAMTAMAPAPANQLYYAGLILVVIYCNSIAHLRCIYATIITSSLFFCYQAVAVAIAPIPAYLLINNDFFLGTAVVVGIIWSYSQELYLRHNFINTHLLIFEKVRSERLSREAQAANHAKSEFLAAMSHELRTPLNAIIGFTEVMKLQIFGPVGSDRYMSYVDDIHNSGAHLLSIINDILDLAKAEANKLTLIEEQFDLCQIIDGCIRMFRDTAASQGVRLGFSMPRERPILRADLRLLRQVLINLVSNAIKFTLTGGSVTLSIQCNDEGCRIKVEDTGIGIAHEDLDKILEPFVQVESAHSRKHGGTGLGLPLVKRIVELHGGTLELESEIGIGTRMTVSLPPERVLQTRPAPEPMPLRGLTAAPQPSF